MRDHVKPCPADFSHCKCGPEGPVGLCTRGACRSRVRHEAVGGVSDMSTTVLSISLLSPFSLSSYSLFLLSFPSLSSFSLLLLALSLSLCLFLSLSICLHLSLCLSLSLSFSLCLSRRFGSACYQLLCFRNRPAVEAAQRLRAAMARRSDKRRLPRECTTGTLGP